MDTIVALSSGQGRAGIAVVRLSGPHVRFVIETITRRVLEPRVAALVTIRQADGSVLDRCLALFFPAPYSATGDDTLELHLHGSPGVVRAAINRLTSLHPEIRLARAGEFTRRSLENGKLDLLGVEALGELLEAETERQVAQAQRLLQGDLTRSIAAFRDEITDLRALIEADIDFSDEGDVPTSLWATAQREASRIASSLRSLLAGAQRGERMREGAIVAIIGPPNVGKSSLINALSGRDVAIVSNQPGTTRDTLEAPISLDGWPVILVDTAGVRDSEDSIEREGMRRARAAAERAALCLRLVSVDVPVMVDMPPGIDALTICTKSDLGTLPGVELAVSVAREEGLLELRTQIAERVAAGFEGEAPAISRARQASAVRRAAEALEAAAGATLPEFCAEELRRGSHALGELLGVVDVEQVLDRLFAGFCIGK